MVSTVPKTRPLLHWLPAALLLIPLLAAPLARAQTATPAPAAAPTTTQNAAAPGVPAQGSPAVKAAQGLAFWDLPDRAMTIMLADPPRKEEDRYARLRHYFTLFGCTGDNLSGLVLRNDKRHPSLVCTLPGATASKIIVTAWLPRSESFEGAADGWPDAVLLPMLYHALQAQPRHSTFVFAELAGEHGDTDFQKHLEAGGAAGPLAIVSVQLLGFGQQAFFNLAARDLAPAVRSNSEALQIEAWRLIRIRGIDTSRESVTGQFSAGPNYQPYLVRDGPKDIPRILFSSNIVVPPGKDPAFSLDTFHRNHDFLAFYLADIDTKLNGSR